MLMNDFYQISQVTSGDDSIEGTIHFNATHPIFQGHFPGQPVVPGVCTMQLVKEIMEWQRKQPMQLTDAPQVKFLQLITPEMTPQFSIKWTEAGNNVSVQASLRTEKDVFKISGNYRFG